MKAQSSVEFMAIFSLLLVVVIIATMVSVQNTSSLVESKKDMEVGRLLEYVGGRIDAAYIAGHGFSSNVTIPETILGFDYTLNISQGSNMIYISMPGSDYPRDIITDNMTGEFRKGWNTISNVEGLVVIS
jgi:hypothetical protein